MASNHLATTITRKGQVTIPKHIRDSMKLEPGCRLVFDINGAGELVLRRDPPVEESRPDRFDLALGSAEIKWDGTTDEYMAMIRDYEDDDPGLR